MRLLPFVVLLVFLIACETAVPAAAPPPPPLENAPKTPTPTAEPTSTPVLTRTVEPTATAVSEPTPTPTATPEPEPSPTPRSLMPQLPPSVLTPMPMPTFPSTPTPAPVSLPASEFLFVFEVLGFDISPTEPVGGVSTATRTLAFGEDIEIGVIGDEAGEVIATHLRFPIEQSIPHDELVTLSALMDVQLDTSWIFQVFEVNREGERIIHWGDYASPFIDIWVYPFIDGEQEYVTVEFIVK